MKKIVNSSLSIAALLFVLILAGCSKDLPSKYAYENSYHFQQKSKSVNGCLNINIPVIFTAQDGSKGTSTQFAVTSTSTVPLVAGTDYVILNTASTLNFANGTKHTDTIKIALIPNSVIDPDRILKIKLTNSVGGKSGFAGPSSDTTNNEFTVTIKESCGALSGNFTPVTVGCAQGDGTGGCDPGFVNYSFSAAWAPNGVSITSASPCDNINFTLDDITMGLYPGGYSDVKQPAALIYNPSTGVFTVDSPNTPDGLAGGNFYGTGQFDPCTGIITFNWYNDYGMTGATLLTPR